MAIILNKYHGANYTTDKLIIADDMYAETKEELNAANLSSSTDIIGLPEGYTLTKDSKAHTPDFHIAMLNGQGTWNWDDDEENS